MILMKNKNGNFLKKINKLDIFLSFILSKSIDIDLSEKVEIENAETFNWFTFGFFQYIFGPSKSIDLLKKSHLKINIFYMKIWKI